MLCFDILINGKRLCTAGVGDAGVLSAIITWVRNPESPNRRERSRAGVTDLHVGGISRPGNDSLQWARPTLHPGDEVVVRVLDDGEVDSPVHRTPGTVRDERESRRYRYRLLKKKYLELKREFEPDDPVPPRKTARARKLKTPIG